MVNNEVNTKVSYLKQIEETLRNKTFENYQKELKAMRMHIDSLIKTNGQSGVKVKNSDVSDVTGGQIKFVKKGEFVQTQNKPKVMGENTRNNRPFSQNRNNDNNGVRPNNNRYGNNNTGNARYSQKFGNPNNDQYNNRVNNGKRSGFQNIKNAEKTSSKLLKEFTNASEAVATNVEESKNRKYNNRKRDSIKDNYEDFEKSKRGIRDKNSKYSTKYNDFDSEILMNRKAPKKKNASNVETPQNTIVIKKAVMTSEKITIKELSEKIGKTVPEIVKKLFLLSINANINSSIDYDTASLITGEFGIELEQKVEKTAEDIMIDTRNEQDSEENLQPRPPIITVMGHVDHGKTSLLDAIRKTHIANNEAGGITQHIGAYTIVKNGRPITFIDTPGHEAFTAMRARGVKLTDIAILVVAADDGVKPQTIEAIEHIKKAKVPMIVAINKIDAPQANVEKVKQQLTEYDVLPEEWGGDAIIVPISARTGEGLDKLLDMMLLVADIENLRANPNRDAVTVVIESKLDRGRGPVATLLIENGTLKIGNTIVCGTTIGKIRAMIDQNGNNVVSASPSYAVEVLGFGEVPKAGDVAQVVEEKLAKQIVQERKVREQIKMMNSGNGISMEDFLNKTGDKTILNVIVKTDVQGSLEAILHSIEGIKNEEVEVRCVHGGVGNVNENDILLAQTSKAMILSFNVKTENKAQKVADKEKIAIRNYSIIYDMLDDINEAVKALVKPKFREVYLGQVEVRMVYKITNSGLIAGCYVKQGAVRRNAIAKVYRGEELITTTVIDELKQFKDNVKEVTEGFECGIKLRDPEFKEGDLINIYVEEQIKE